MDFHTSTSPEATAPLQQVAFVTLGCAKNEVDTARMKQELRHAGYAVG